MKPGLREHALIAAIVRLCTNYLGRSVEQQLIVRAPTRPGLPLHGFSGQRILPPASISIV